MNGQKRICGGGRARGSAHMSGKLAHMSGKLARTSDDEVGSSVFAYGCGCSGAEGCLLPDGIGWPGMRRSSPRVDIWLHEADSSSEVISGLSWCDGAFCAVINPQLLNLNNIIRAIRPQIWASQSHACYVFDHNISMKTLYF